MLRSKFYFKIFIEILLSYYYRVSFFSKLNWFVLQNRDSIYLNPVGKIPLHLNKEKIIYLKNFINSKINNLNQATLKKEKLNDKNFENCIIIVPEIFLNEDTHVGKGFFGPVNILILMLRNNFTNVEIIPLAANLKPGSKIKLHLRIESLMQSNNYKNDETFCILFSVTYLTQNCEIDQISNFIIENSIYCIGYLTSTNKNPVMALDSINKLGCVNLMVDYSGSSELNKINSTRIPVTHMPWIPTERIITNKQFTLSIAYSGLVKFNRSRWVVATSAIAKSYAISISIRLYSWTAVKKGIQNFVIRNELLEWFSNYSLGLVILCRSPEINDGLIGSFWDVYHAGTIPLVQFEGTDYFLADYLEPYVDYLPFTTVEDLAMILELLQESPEILDKLKNRNLLRRKLDLSIEKIGIFLANTINNHR